MGWKKQVQEIEGQSHGESIEWSLGARTSVKTTIFSVAPTLFSHVLQPAQPLKANRGMTKLIGCGDTSGDLSALLLERPIRARGQVWG